MAHEQTEVAFCGEDAAALRMIKTAPATDYYRIRLSADAVGVESAVAVKNGYALGIALTIGVNQRRHGTDSELISIRRLPFSGNLYGRCIGCCSCRARNACQPGARRGRPVCHRIRRQNATCGHPAGQGVDIDGAKDKLRGVTLELLVVAQRVARALRVKIGKGPAKKEDFSLLTHIDEILTKKAAVSIPWEDFTV